MTGPLLLIENLMNGSIDGNIVRGTGGGLTPPLPLNLISLIISFVRLRLHKMLNFPIEYTHHYSSINPRISPVYVEHVAFSII